MNDILIQLGLGGGAAGATGGFALWMFKRVINGVPKQLKDMDDRWERRWEHMDKRLEQAITMIGENRSDIKVLHERTKPKT